MLHLMAFLPVYTLDGTKKDRQLYWDQVSHRSMANVATTAEQNAPLILKDYPGAIMGLTENREPISKTDMFTFPIQSLVVNDMTFMEKLCDTINQVIQGKDEHMIDVISKKSEGKYSREYFGELKYPIVDVAANDVSEVYREIAYDNESVIIHRSIDYGHGIILRSDALHLFSYDQTDEAVEESDESRDRYITQISLLVKRDSSLLSEYPIDRIQTELVKFFSDVVAWQFEAEVSVSGTFIPFKAGPFSLLKMKALTSII